MRSTGHSLGCELPGEVGAPMTTPEGEVQLAAVAEATSLADLIALGQTAGMLERLVPGLMMPVVLDTNVIYEELRRLANGKPSSLLLAAQVGTARLLTTPQVVGEVYEHLDRLARTPDQRTALEAIFREQYLPRLRVIDTRDVAFDDSRLRELRAGDPDDVPTAKLVLLVGPACLFTNDKLMRRLGLATTWLDPLRGEETWTIGAVATRDQGLVLAIGFGGATVLSLTVASVDNALDRISKNDEVRQWLAVGLLVLAGLALLLWSSPESRQQLERAARSLGSAAMAATKGVATALLVAANAQTTLARNAIRPAQPAGPRERLARLLVVSPPGLTLDQIRAALPDLDDPEAHLHASRIFVEDGPGRWSLGVTGTSYSAPGAFPTP